MRWLLYYPFLDNLFKTIISNIISMKIYSFYSKEYLALDLFLCSFLLAADTFNPSSISFSHRVLISTAVSCSVVNISGYRTL